MSAALHFTGVYPILATPFKDDESIDLASLERLVGFMADVGVDGVTVLGVLGEANRMLDAEREEIIATAVAATGGRIPVIVGASHPGTRATVGLSRMAEKRGAAAVMISPSHEPVPSEDRIFDYFKRVAAETALPIVAQDHPASTQVHMSVPLVLRLAGEIERIVCIKEEAPPTPARFAALNAGMKSRKLPILTGLGALYGMFDLEAGSAGYNTGFAFPEVLQAMVRAMQAGDREKAWAVYERFLPLIVFEQQPGVAIRKEILRRRGLIGSAKVRHPGAPLSESGSRQLDAILERALPGVDLSRPLVV